MVMGTEMAQPDAPLGLDISAGGFVAPVFQEMLRGGTPVAQPIQKPLRWETPRTFLHRAQK